MQLILHSCNPKTSDNRYAVVSNLECQVIIDVTFENDAKVIVEKYHSPTFDDGPVQVALFNSPAS